MRFLERGFFVLLVLVLVLDRQGRTLPPEHATVRSGGSPQKLMQHANHAFGVGQTGRVHLAFIGRPAGRDYAAPLQRSCNAMV